MPVSELLFGPAPIVWLQELIGSGFSPLFRSVSLLGDTWGLLVGLTIARWLFGRSLLLALLPLLALEGASYLLINTLVEIPRPTADEVIQYEQLSISAFPSGHTYLATILWGYLYARRFIPILLAAAIPLSVGFARLNLGVHNVGDVLAGLGLGALVVWGYTLTWPRIRVALENLGTRSGQGIAAAVVVLTPIVLVAMGENPRWWQIGGMAVGAAVALSLDRAPGSSSEKSEGAPPMRMAIGLAGVLAAMLVHQLWTADALLAGALTAGSGTLWALLMPGVLIPRPK